MTWIKTDLSKDVLPVGAKSHILLSNEDTVLLLLSGNPPELKRFSTKGVLLSTYTFTGYSATQTLLYKQSDDYISVIVIGATSIDTFISTDDGVSFTLGSSIPWTLPLVAGTANSAGYFTGTLQNLFLAYCYTSAGSDYLIFKTLRNGASINGSGAKILQVIRNPTAMTMRYSQPLVFLSIKTDGVNWKLKGAYWSGSTGVIPALLPTDPGIWNVDTEPVYTYNYSSNLLELIWNERQSAATEWKAYYSISTTSGISAWETPVEIAFFPSHETKVLAVVKSGSNYYFLGKRLVGSTWEQFFAVTNSSFTVTSIELLASSSPLSDADFEGTDLLHTSVSDFLLHSNITTNLSTLLSTSFKWNNMPSILQAMWIKYASTAITIDGTATRGRIKTLRSRKSAAYPEVWKGFPGDLLMSRPFGYGPTITEDSSIIVYNGTSYLAKKDIVELDGDEYWVERWLLYLDQTPPSAPSGLR